MKLRYATMAIAGGVTCCAATCASGLDSQNTSQCRKADQVGLGGCCGHHKRPSSKSR